MQHVDDGTIHAWLDGELDAATAAAFDAHVRECPACAARVADERTTLARAGALLSAAAPPAQPPAFREIAAQAGYASMPRRRWIVPVGWAASLALAAGLGWTARDIADNDPEAPVTPPAIADRAAAPTPVPAAPAPQAAPAPVSVETPAPERAANRSPSGPRPERRVAGERASPAPPAPPMAVTGVTDSVAVESAAAPAPPPALVAATLQRAAWQTVPRTEAAARTGMALYAIDGLEPVLTAISPDGRSVRSVFRLETGETVDVEQQRPAADTAGPSPAAGTTATTAAPRRAFVSAGGAVMADTAPPARVWTSQRGDVLITLRTTSTTTDLNAIGNRLRVD